MMASKNAAPAELKFVNTRHLSEIVGYSTYHVRFLARAKKIPSEKFGRSLRFEPQAVLRALRDMK